MTMVYAGAGEYQLDVPYEIREHFCRHQRRSCPRCVVCFHGRHRCQFCFRTTSGLPAPAPRVRLRCATCGRFRPKGKVVDMATGIPVDRCSPCLSRGFVALALF